MATPNAVSRQVTDKYISTFDIHKPAYVNTLFRRYGDQGQGYFMMLNTLGAVTPVDQTSYFHYEEGWIHATFHSRTTVSDPGAGAPVLVTLSAADLDANNNFYPRLNDGVYFPSGVTGTVYSIDVSTPSAPVLTIYPDVATDNIGAISAGTELVIYTNSFAEGTDQPKGRISRPDKYTFNTQIIKEAFDITGSEMTNALYVEKDSQGNPIGGMYMRGQLEADYRMSLAIDGAGLFAKPVDNPVLVAAEQRKMQGLIPWVIAGGNVATYTSGLLSLSQFDQAVRRLDKNFAPNEMLCLNGIDVQLEYDNMFLNLFNSNPIIFAGNGNGQKATDLGVELKSITKGGRTFHMQKMGVFSNPKLYGAPGYVTAGLSVMTPINKVKDPRSGQNMDSMSFRYKQLGSYSRKMETWPTGSAGEGVKTDGVDNRKINHRSEIGTEFFGANRFYMLKTA